MHHDPRLTPTPQPDDASLDALLRGPAVATPRSRADDPATFATRVMRALPPPVFAAGRRARRRRTALIITAAAAGCASAWLLGGAGLVASTESALHLARAAAEQMQSAEGLAHALAVAGSVILMFVFAGRRMFRGLLR